MVGKCQLKSYNSRKEDFSPTLWSKYFKVKLYRFLKKMYNIVSLINEEMNYNLNMINAQWIHTHILVVKALLELLLYDHDIMVAKVSYIGVRWIVVLMLHHVLALPLSQSCITAGKYRNNTDWCYTTGAITVTETKPRHFLFYIRIFCINDMFIKLWINQTGWFGF